MFIAVQLYELYQRYQAEQRAEREEEYYWEVNARQEALARARHATEEERAKSLADIALHLEILTLHTARFTGETAVSGVNEPHQ